MTASMVDYMEQNSYEAARRDYCIPSRESERIAMPELFHLIAGAETGAIIASSLVTANTDPSTKDIQPNAFFATKVKEWFYDNTETLYHNTHVNIWLKIVTTVLFVIALSVLTYKLVERHFNDPKYDENVADLKKLIKIEKKIRKNKDVADHK